MNMDRGGSCALWTISCCRCGFVGASFFLPSSSFSLLPLPPSSRLAAQQSPQTMFPHMHVHATQRGRKFIRDE